MRKVSGPKSEPVARVLALEQGRDDPVPAPLALTCTTVYTSLADKRGFRQLVVTRSSVPLMTDCDDVNGILSSSDG